MQAVRRNRVMSLLKRLPPCIPPPLGLRLQERVHRAEHSIRQRETIRPAIVFALRRRADLESCNEKRVRNPQPLGVGQPRREIVNADRKRLIIS